MIVQMNIDKFYEKSTSFHEKIEPCLRDKFINVHKLPSSIQHDNRHTCGDYDDFDDMSKVFMWYLLKRRYL
jgi:hypothetical protein